MTEHGEWVAMTETFAEQDARLVAELLTGAPPPEVLRLGPFQRWLNRRRLQ